MWAGWLLAALMLAAQPAMARPNTDVVSGKIAAPDQEDSANYFSANRHNATPQDLQKADKLRRKTISSIEDLLKAKKKSTRRFELLLRLGELHVERHDYLRDLEMARYDKAWDKWSKTKKGKEPKLDGTSSTNEMLQAANSFRRLVTEFPHHPRTDAALYSLGKTLGRLGKDTSIDYYQQLIRTFPKSKLVPDTYLSMGEYYFDKHQIQKALAAYRKVLDFKDNRAFPYAVYKLGWAYYNAPAKNDKEAAANYKKSVTAFKLVVKLADRDKDDPAKHNLNLRDEAIKDLVMVWADGEDVASAYRYFRTIGQQDAFYKMLERLGNIYADQGKNTQAIAVFRRLLKDAPNRDNSPAIEAKLVDLYDLTNNIQAVVAELRNMNKLYLGQTAWTAANAKDPDALKEANRLAELSTHRYGALYHQRGEKAKSDVYLKSAAQIYTLYLASFPDNPNAYELRYYLAEILYNFKQYEAAAQHYMIVAKANPKGKYLKPAALNAVAAMNQLVQATKWPQLPPAGQAPNPLPIPHAKQHFVQTIDQYVALLPKEKDGQPMRFTAAQIYFDYGHYKEALARFDRITKEIPDTKQAKAAVRVILAYYSDKADWNNLAARAHSFSKQPKLLDDSLRKYVVEVMRGAMFKKALAFEKASKFDLAAESFVEYQKEFPTDQSADRALYDAMLDYYKVSRVETAVATGNIILSKYAKSSLVPDVLANIGSTHEALARFDKAAAMYKRLALSYPSDKRSPNALYNAAILYKGLTNLDEATHLLQEFTHRYPDNAIAPQATMELASTLEKQGHTQGAIQAYKEYARRYKGIVDQNFYAAAKAAALETFGADHAAGLKDLHGLAKTLSAKGAPPALEARTTVAEALFKLAEPSFGEFQALQITDGDKIEKQVENKQAKLEKLAANYEKIIDVGSAEYAVASLYRLGEAHENFANALFKAPAPKGSSQTDIDKLRTELEKVAFPLKDQAYKFYETAYKRSREVQTFTAWTRKTYQKMVELAPDKHPAVNALSAEPSYLAHDVKMTKSVASLFGDN